MHFVVHGGWGEWIADDDCDLWCGTSTQTRYRYCDNPTPNATGDDCVGDDEDDGTFPCEGRVCPCKKFSLVRGLVDILLTL